MSQEQTLQKIGFGYIDDTSKDLQSKQGGKFGLNQGVFLTKFELNTKAGSDGAEQDALDIHIQVADREQRLRIYPTEKVYDKDNKEITDKNSAEYIKAYNDDWTQKTAVIVHTLKCFRTDEEVRQGMSAPANSFGEFINICAGLLPDNFASKPLDVFLEWQWNIAPDNDRTFLQLPKNMKGGAFLAPHTPAVGTWEEVRTENGLEYRDSANGNLHPFNRSANYMESNKANQQIEGQENNQEALAVAAGTGGAKKTGW
jgi:hypothetical protein